MCNYCNVTNCQGQCAYNTVNQNYASINSNSQNWNLQNGNVNASYQNLGNHHYQSLGNQVFHFSSKEKLMLEASKIMCNYCKSIPDDTTMTVDELLNQIVRTLKIKAFI